MPIREEFIPYATGAALLFALADGWSRMPAMTPSAIGYGSGKKDFGPRPNLLRVILGETEPISAENRPPTEVEVIEANLDDMNPEGYDWVTQKLFAAGTLDVTLTPIQMKKGRPGVTLFVVAYVSCFYGNSRAVVKQ